MYNNIFQDYINKMIGNTPKEKINFENSIMIPSNLKSYNTFQNLENKSLERFYPEIYRLLYPMIKTACMRNTKPITIETINEMVKDIYLNFSGDDNLAEVTENRALSNNFLLRDLIKILLIRELI